MYAATGGPNVKWGETDFKWGAGHHWPPRWWRPCVLTWKVYLITASKTESFLINWNLPKLFQFLNLF